MVLHCHPALLVVAWENQVMPELRFHRAPMVIGGGADEVAQYLLCRSLARARAVRGFGFGNLVGAALYGSQIAALLPQQRFDRAHRFSMTDLRISAGVPQTAQPGAARLRHSSGAPAA